MRVNFKGIYKVSIPKTRKEEIRDIKEMSCFGDTEVVVSSPFSEDADDFIKESDERIKIYNGWFKAQTEKNGLRYPRCFNEELDVFLLTGKDAHEYRKAFKLKKMQNPDSLLKTIQKVINNQDIKQGNETLNRLLGYIKFISEQEQKFDKFLVGKTIQPIEEALNE